MCVQCLCVCTWCACGSVCACWCMCVYLHACSVCACGCMCIYMRAVFVRVYVGVRVVCIRVWRACMCVCCASFSDTEKVVVFLFLFFLHFFHFFSLPPRGPSLWDSACAALGTEPSAPVWRPPRARRAAPSDIRSRIWFIFWKIEELVACWFFWKKEGKN